MGPLILLILLAALVVVPVAFFAACVGLAFAVMIPIQWVAERFGRDPFSMKVEPDDA